jgi:hypothetical protein
MIASDRKACSRDDQTETASLVAPLFSTFPDGTLPPEALALIFENPEIFARIVPGAHGPVSENLRHRILGSLEFAGRALRAMQAVLREYPDADIAYNVFALFHLNQSLGEAAKLLQRYRNCRECAGEG